MIGDFVCGDAKLPADHEAEKPEVAALLKEIAVQRELIDDILGGALKWTISVWPATRRYLVSWSCVTS